MSLDTTVIAVPYENGQIFQHFGHAAAFKLYEVGEGKIIRAEVVSTVESGHGALVAFLTRHNVETLICGGIGSGAQNALLLSGIKLHGGVSGSADEAVDRFIRGTLGYTPIPKCGHDHGSGHKCGTHGCGSHDCR